MTAPEFAHLHVHSEYSLLDGANRIRDLVKACLEDGQESLALTDHGNMFGAVELFKACKAAGVRPILGCEVYIAQNSRKEPHHKVRNPYSHLTLLARDEEGYRNLLALNSLAYIEGYHFRPRVDKEILSQHARGVTCLSGCLSGEINKLFRSNKQEEAAQVAAELRDLFGPEHFWLELQRNGIEIQDKVNEALVDLSRRTNIPLVATNDIHYLRHEDCQAQDVLLCINTGAKRDDEKRFRFDTDSLFFRTREEMAHTFRDLPETVPATLDVAEQVGFEMTFGTYHLPVFTPDGGETAEELFDRLCEEGLRSRYSEEQLPKARERLAYERGVIEEMGFSHYFLIVWDLIRWARENGIPVGPGRGSAAGSIVAYALDITRVCPLRYDLLFERFLNSARISMPDIDIDFCKEGRERVLEYTRERYGADKVSQIGTFATMASRSVVRDVGRVLDLPLSEVDRIAKKIPSGPGSPPLAQAIKDPELAEMAKDPSIRQLFEFSVKLDGMARHISTHAAGVVIADRPIMEHVPLCKHGDDIVTQYSGKYLEELGLLKMDYLGLRTLTILAKALENVRALGEVPPELETIPLVDKPTFALLNRGDTLGVFQLESEGMRKLIGRLRPDCFEDLIAILALYRPGPLESGMDDMFIRRKHGLEEISYPHPSLEPILSDTYGCIVYQEQVMLISNVLGNFSLNEADNLRKAMGKKKPELMKKYAAQFLDGAESNGCARPVAQEIWDNIVKFGGYGFNKSHSTAYALITWQTAYMKTHHRIPFIAANMSCEMSNSDKIKDFVDECRQVEIPVLPPDIERSRWEFKPEGEAIRFGFGAIKGTGQKAIEAFEVGRAKLRQAAQPLTLHKLCAEVDPQSMTKLTWEALIKGGAFESTGHNRGAVLAGLETAMTEGNRAASDRRSGQGALFGGPAVEEETSTGDGIDDRAGLPKKECLNLEYEVLGFYLSGHPLEERAGLFSILSTTNTRDIQSLPGGAEITLGGLVVGFKENTTRKGKKMARFRLEDLQGGVNVTVFPRTFAECRELLADDRILICRGKLEDRDEDDQSAVGLLLNQVMDVEQAITDFNGGLVVSLTPADEDKIDELANILQEHRGDKRLFLEIEGRDGKLRRVRAGERHRVRISSALATSVEKLIGKGKAKLARI